MKTSNVQLPQLTASTFMTDGGIETDIIFNKGIPLPEFAAFTLLNTNTGAEILKAYFEDYLNIALEHCGGFILELPTYRANPDWILKLGYPIEFLNEIHQKAFDILGGLKTKFENEQFKIPISVCIGPRGNGYIPNQNMTISAAEKYHTSQIAIATKLKADLVSAFTMNYNEEAIGITQAAKTHQIPVVISYTLETDGHLPSGQSLKDAITETDKFTNNYVSYYMINCAHPEHFKHVLSTESSWTNRIKGIRANASNKSHAELDESDTLDSGDKTALALEYSLLKTLLPNLTIIGGCCGTDHSHLKTICEHWFKS